MSDNQMEQDKAVCVCGHTYADHNAGTWCVECTVAEYVNPCQEFRRRVEEETGKLVNESVSDSQSAQCYPPNLHLANCKCWPKPEQAAAPEKHVGRDAWEVAMSIAKEKYFREGVEAAANLADNRLERGWEDLIDEIRSLTPALLVEDGNCTTCDKPLAEHSKQMMHCPGQHRYTFTSSETK